MLNAGNRQVRENIADGEHSPSSARKEWPPTTKIDCKSGIYEPLPEDGVVNIVIGKNNFTVFSLRSSVIFVANEYPENLPRCVAALYL